MKTFKLVAGILCIILSTFVVFQSCAAGLYNAMSESGEVSGTAGTIAAVMLLSGGIVMIATQKSEGKGGSIAAAVVFIIGALVGFTNAGSYSDLKIWSGLMAVLAVINLVPLFVKKKETEE